MQRRLRLTLLAIAAFVVALVVAAVIAAYLMLQPQRFTDLLRAQARKAGLSLALSVPAEPTLWPRPAVVLHGLTLSVDNRPVLVAARVRLVVPWRTLLGGPPAITRLELDAPRVNLAQLGPVLAHLPQRPAGPPLLPHVDAGIRVSHGSLVRGNQLLLGDIRLQTGRLTPGQVFRLRLAAHLADGQPVTLTLAMTPRILADAIAFDAIHVTAGRSSDLRWVLDGRATWRGGSKLAMSLHGTLDHGRHHRYDTALTLIPATTDTPFLLRVKLDGPGLDADLRMPPSRLVAWWRTISADNAPADIPLPPLEGSVSAKTITLGDTTIEGLQVTADTPVAATSAPARATSAAVSTGSGVRP